MHPDSCIISILCLFKYDLSSLFLPFIYNFKSLILLFRHVNHFPSKTCKHLQPNFYLYSLQILFFLLVAKMCIITISEKHYYALYASSDVLLKGSFWKSLLPFSFVTILFSVVLKIEAFSGRWMAVTLEVFVLCLRIVFHCETNLGAVSH